MLKRLLNSRPVVLAFALALLVLVTEANHLVGPEMILPAFYLLPILLVAWQVNIRWAVALACLGTVGELGNDLLHSHFATPLVPYWNAAMRLAVYLVAAVAVAAVRRLRQVNARLRASEALREDLTNMLIHDLKNPLVAASMALRIFQQRRRSGADQGEQGAHEQEELLHIALESQERLRRLIEDLLEIAQAEAKEMPLNLQEVDLAQVVREAVEEAAPRVARGERQLVASYPPQPLPATIDAAKIRRVVDNLLDNALKYAPPEGHLQVCVKCCGAQVLTSVSDDGPGIPPELLQRIFDKFGQAEALRAGRRMSVGLGLAFARLAVEAHGGRIWVESVPQQGATFTFALPLTNQRPA